MYLWSTRYNASKKKKCKLFMIFFHPRARYDVKCICGAPSIASGGGNHRHQRDGNRRSAHSPILAYPQYIVTRKACRLKQLPKGERLRGTWKCRKKFVPKVFPSLDVFHSRLPRIRVFLFPPIPSLRSFIRFNLSRFSTRVCF